MLVHRLRPASSVSRFPFDPVATDEPTPKVGPRDVRTTIRACSLNYRDLLVRKGTYGGDPDGLVPLSDGAGEVVEVGAEVTRFRPGDRVAANFFANWPGGPFSQEAADSALGGARDGMMAEHVVLPESAWVTIPEHLDFNQAACLPCAGVTAWNGLFQRGPAPTQADTVLTMGTGGVSLFALAMTRAVGARAILTSRSAAKLEKVRDLWQSWGGATDRLHLIDTTTQPEWERAVRDLTNGRGADRIIELGGPGTLARSYKATAYNGHIALIGVLAGLEPTGNPFVLAMRNATLHGVYVGSTADFEAMNAFLHTHRLVPVIEPSAILPASRLADAYDLLASGTHLGKVVVEMER
ncbi:Alcohol dehydrogenase zinc-binding domain protein [Isosphaera pallida ATCC 43644]|jgi:NADPH:quinone reductase-like Zn-dependent oxidoreductase|uniref:Alcohol dehydrogenase zinc-binding domain protein n=1 Tax=Isosphaera pallida (strain ATCC 43644 / DSM 9630 / IS1B) TaxID=575540 RepID=E8R4D0_ISOPI|nr:NAD(P)-dependent alcohol dehydrogenase [Isosphaera pallida]ADV62731.1 Alcohol dehydrogenase zinc-binding domain protein [Isosphaera pallida ATCC 43644]